MKKPSRATLAEIATYILGALLSLTGAGVVLQLWRADLSVPFVYGADAAFTAAFTKGLIDHGSAVINPSIGAPGSGSLLDFPTAEAIHQLSLRLLGYLTGDFASAINLYFLLGFALAAVTSIAVLRSVGMSRIAAVTVSILYALLPYHFMRGQFHLFLSAYWMVPLGVLLCLWVLSSKVSIFAPDAWRLEWRTWRMLWIVVICLIVGASGVYYAFFTCFLLVVAGVSAAVRFRESKRLVAALLIVVLIVGSLAAGIAQSVRFRVEEGANADAAQRRPEESVRYALRLPQLILPITGHRVSALADIKDKYHSLLAATSPDSDNENDTSSLGIVLGLGFVLLIGFGLWNPRMPRDELPRSLATLNLAAFLLATVDGFGAIFAMLVSPQIRAYNRLSVYIAFLAAAFIGWAIDRVRARAGSGLGITIAIAAACAVLVVFGAFDQTSADFVPAYASNRAVYETDAEFVQRIETLVPAGASIFQLPYMPFPESGPVGRMPDYEHFRAYLHSTDTRWSYGAMRGRSDSLWQRDVAALPPAEMLRALKDADFGGVWIDTRAYEDDGRGLIAELEAASGERVITSADGRAVFMLLPAVTP